MILLLMLALMTVYIACTAIACALTSNEGDPMSDGLAYTFIVLFSAFLVYSFWRSPVVWVALVVAVWLRWAHSRHPAVLSITSGAPDAKAASDS